MAQRLLGSHTEIVNAQMYRGVHYRTSGEIGAAMGHKERSLRAPNGFVLSVKKNKGRICHESTE
jgi:hypothetical protein